MRSVIRDAILAAGVIAPALCPALAGAQVLGEIDSATLRAAEAVVGRTAIPLHELTYQAEQGMQWTGRNVVDFAPAIEAAGKAVGDLHSRHPSAVADMYGNGTLTNMEESFKMAFGIWGGSNLERGCISHQQAVWAAVKPILEGGSLEARKIRILRKGFPHNAVIVFPRGKDWRKSGVVLDGWIRQKSSLDKMTFAYKDWDGALDGGARLLDD